MRAACGGHVAGNFNASARTTWSSSGHISRASFGVFTECVNTLATYRLSKTIAFTRVVYYYNYVIIGCMLQLHQCKCPIVYVFAAFTELILKAGILAL